MMVTPAIYRKLAKDREDYVEGQYRYWYTASWRGGSDYYRSIREWVALNVEALERRAEDGDVELGVDEDEAAM